MRMGVLKEVEGGVEGALVAEPGVYAAAAALIVLAVPSQRHPAEQPPNRTNWISAEELGHASCAPSAAPRSFGTYVPVLRPLREIGMVHSAVSAHMLPRPQHHVQGWRYVYHGRFMRVQMRYPNGEGIVVCGSSEVAISISVTTIRACRSSYTGSVPAIWRRRTEEPFS